MMNIIRILREAEPRSLVLLDELGAGTDPSEGAALGRAILSALLGAGASVMATTHHGELKLFAHEREPLLNASVDFDPQTLAPTYQLRLGLPGRSNAIAIARRLGLPEAVLAEAASGMNDDEAQVDHLLADLQREHAAAQEARTAEEFARRETEEIRQALGERREQLEGERDALMAQTERRMEDELAGIRRALRAAEKVLVKGRKQDIESARRQVAEGERRLGAVRQDRAEIRRARAGRLRMARPKAASIQTGDEIFLEGIAQAGQALGPVDEQGQVEVLLGSLRTRVPLSQVERAGRGEPSRGSVHYSLHPVAAGSRLEVRGQTLDEAIPALESFLDQAYRAGLQRLEVVHGKGTGTLRTAVRKRLGEHPLVSSFEGAVRREGGEGVTIVRMAV